MPSVNRLTVAYVAYIVAAIAVPFMLPRYAAPVFVAFTICYAMWSGTTHDMPSLWGAVVTLLIFTATTMAAWLQWGTIPSAHKDVHMHLARSLWRFESAVEAVHEQSGQYPESLAELPETMFYEQFRVDPWGRPYEFIVTENDFRMESRGRDGVPGGVGIDTDWSLGPDDSVRGVEIPVPFRLPFQSGNRTVLLE